MITFSLSHSNLSQSKKGPSPLRETDPLLINTYQRRLAQVVDVSSREEVGLIQVLDIHL